MSTHTTFYIVWMHKANIHAHTQKITSASSEVIQDRSYVFVEIGKKQKFEAIKTMINKLHQRPYMHHSILTSQVQ